MIRYVKLSIENPLQIFSTFLHVLNTPLAGIDIKHCFLPASPHSTHSRQMLFKAGQIRQAKLFQRGRQRTLNDEVINSFSS
jgi:hypothetical protein